MAYVRLEFWFGLDLIESISGLGLGSTCLTQLIFVTALFYPTLGEPENMGAQGIRLIKAEGMPLSLLERGLDAYTDMPSMLG